MSRRLVVTTRRADEDIAQAVAFYLETATTSVAEEFVGALEATVQLIARHPSIGSQRFAAEAGLPEVRGVALQRFPYIVFSTEDPDAIRVHRVLHTSRDLPAEFA